MHKTQMQVENFHVAMGQTVGETPAIRDADLRASLILEEAIETVVAIVGSKKALALVEKVHGQVQDQLFRPGGKGMAPDLVEAIDGLCDLEYVLQGTAVAFGIDLEPFFDEVHQTNLEKVTGEVRSDGKRLKPPGWKPPRIKEMLEALPGYAGVR